MSWSLSSGSGINYTGGEERGGEGRGGEGRGGEGRGGEGRGGEGRGGEGRGGEGRGGEERGGRGGETIVKQATNTKDIHVHVHLCTVPNAGIKLQYPLNMC